MRLFANNSVYEDSSGCAHSSGCAVEEILKIFLVNVSIQYTCTHRSGPSFVIYFIFVQHVSEEGSYKFLIIGVVLLFCSNVYKQ